MSARTGARATVVAVPTPGLGNTAYLVGCDAEAVAVDVPRDAWRVARVAEEHGWRISHALETHVHNDYLSGARELRRAHGSRVVAPARGRYRFSHDGAQDGFSLALGRGGMVARATPGHTPEHLSWELQDDAGQPTAIFSGGSLLIAGVGRTDLLGPAHTDELTQAQFRSMRRLAELPDEVHVYPTHGAGSFCVAGDGDGPPSSTIGVLRTWNPAFALSDPLDFARELAAGRTRYPTYYRRMAPLNRRGPRLLGATPTPPALSVPQLAEAREAGNHVLDVRDRRAFAASHVSGALNVELGDSLSAYVGWLLPFDAPICLVVDHPAQAIDVVAELLRIGFDGVLGYLEGGITAWAAAAGATSGYATASSVELVAQAAGEGSDGTRILDVRQPYEWAEGAVPQSQRVFVADLPRAIAALDPSTRWLVACRSGARATIAASLLDAAGLDARPVVDGGVADLPPRLLQPVADASH